MSNIAGSDARIGGAGRQNPDRAVRRMFTGDHGLAAREAFLAGRGIGPAHLWLVDDLLTNGRLETILPDHTPPSAPLNMLIVPERAGIARVRLLVEFLAGEFPGIPGIERSRAGSKADH